MRFSCRKLSLATWRVSDGRDGDGVETGLRRSAKSAFQSVIQVRGDEGLTYG